MRGVQYLVALLQVLLLHPRGVPLLVEREVQHQLVEGRGEVELRSPEVFQHPAVDVEGARPLAVHLGDDQVPSLEVRLFNLVEAPEGHADALLGDGRDLPLALGRAVRVDHAHHSLVVSVVFLRPALHVVEHGEAEGVVLLVGDGRLEHEVLACLGAEVPDFRRQSVGHDVLYAYGALSPDLIVDAAVEEVLVVLVLFGDDDVHLVVYLVRLPVLGLVRRLRLRGEQLPFDVLPEVHAVEDARLLRQRPHRPLVGEYLQPLPQSQGVVYHRLAPLLLSRVERDAVL